MQHNREKQQRATFVEVISSIRFDNTPSANESPNESHWPAPGFAENRSLHTGVAAPDDYKQAERSSN